VRLKKYEAKDFLEGDFLEGRSEARDIMLAPPFPCAHYETLPTFRSATSYLLLFLILGSLSGVIINSFSRRLAGEFIEYGILTLILVKAE
jgi:hypothetical protein